jgi:hypothetical protein
LLEEVEMVERLLLIAEPQVVMLVILMHQRQFVISAAQELQMVTETIL